MWGKKCVSVVDNINKVSLSSGLLFSQFRTKNTHTMNHDPTKLQLGNMSTRCGFLSGDANIVSSQVILIKIVM